MATSLDCLELCRLCLVKEHVTVPIFKDGNDVQQIFLKIAACLPVKVSRDDKLPKKICTDCVCKVESFYQFWNTTANAEKQLLQWLGEVDDMGDKQEFVQVLNTNVMKQEQSSDNRLEGNFIQVEGQNSIEMSMIDNMSIITMPAGSEQQFTTVPMDTNGTVQTVQVVSGSSTHAAYDQGEMVEEVEESEEDDMDDGCDNEGLPVKEENEDDQGEQQTTYISVPVTCDEAGPSGLQQQKISDLTEMTLHQSADETGDPKSGQKRARTKIPSILQRKRKFDSESSSNDTVKEDGNSESHSLVTNLSNQPKRMFYVQPIPKDCLSVEISSSSDEMTQEDVIELTDDEIFQVELGEHDYSNSGGLQCGSCDECFPDRSSLLIHQTEKSIERTRAALRRPILKFNCESCKKIFTSKNHLSTHYKDGCGIIEPKNPPSTRKIQSRWRRKQPKKKIVENLEEGPVTCPRCDKVFKKGKYLKVHLTTAHQEKVECQSCEADFTSVADLKQHMSDAHSDLTEVCEVCSKIFYSRQSLKVHMVAHSRDKKPYFVCHICNKGFRHDVYLRKHIQLMHVELKDRKKYQCEYCDYGTHYKNSFRDHLNKHTGEDQVECDVCGKRMRKNYMKIHVRIHTGEKPEICEYCGKAFSARKYLIKHRVTHTGEKNYQCQVCGKRYTQKTTLTLHFRKHHPIAAAATEVKKPKKDIIKVIAVDSLKNSDVVPKTVDKILEAADKAVVETISEKAKEDSAAIQDFEIYEDDGEIEVLEEVLESDEDTEIITYT